MSFYFCKDLIIKSNYNQEEKRQQKEQSFSSPSNSTISCLSPCHTYKKHPFSVENLIGLNNTNTNSQQQQQQSNIQTENYFSISYIINSIQSLKCSIANLENNLNKNIGI